MKNLILLFSSLYLNTILPVYAVSFKPTVTTKQCAVSCHQSDTKEQESAIRKAVNANALCLSFLSDPNKLWWKLRLKKETRHVTEFNTDKELKSTLFNESNAGGTINGQINCKNFSENTLARKSSFSNSEDFHDNNLRESFDIVEYEDHSHSTWNEIPQSLIESNQTCEVVQTITVTSYTSSPEISYKSSMEKDSNGKIILVTKPYHEESEIKKQSKKILYSNQDSVGTYSVKEILISGKISDIDGGNIGHLAARVLDQYSGPSSDAPTAKILANDAMANLKVKGECN